MQLNAKILFFLSHLPLPLPLSLTLKPCKPFSISKQELSAAKYEKKSLLSIIDDQLNYYYKNCI